MSVLLVPISLLISLCLLSLQFFTVSQIMSVIFVTVIENTHDKLSLKVKILKKKVKMKCYFQWCDRSCLQVVLIKTLEVGVMKNKYQLGPREKCFQLSSIFLFCVRESSSTSFFSWMFGILFCFLYWALNQRPYKWLSTHTLSQWHTPPAVYTSLMWHGWLYQSE